MCKEDNFPLLLSTSFFLLLFFFLKLSVSTLAFQIIIRIFFCRYYKKKRGWGKLLGSVIVSVCDVFFFLFGRLFFVFVATVVIF